MSSKETVETPPTFGESTRKITELLSRGAFNEVALEILEATPEIGQLDQPTPDQLAAENDAAWDELMAAAQAGITAAKAQIYAQHEANRQTALDQPQ